jgi:transmembrane sensor
MSHVINYSDGSAITREASAWIAQLDGDDAPSREDLAALQEWMSRSPAHRKEIERLAALWGDLNVLTELAGSTSSAIQNTSSKSSGQPARWTWAMAGVAASAMVAVTAWLLTSTQPGAPVAAFEQAYSTEIGQQLHEQLPDGSRLVINTDSELIVEFSEGERRIRMSKGEVHFEVAKDASRPFVVLVADGAVRAVGTAFSVRLQQHDIEVTVAEGSVELATLENASPREAAGDTGGATAKPLKKLAVLEAGQTASFNDRIESLQAIPEAELAKKLSWKEGMLVFSGDPLGEVVLEVGRYTRSNIVFADPALSELRVGGQFRVGEIDALFDALEVSFGVDVERENNRIILSKAQSRSGS